MPRYQYDPNAKQPFVSSEYNLWGIKPGEYIDVDVVLPSYFPFTLIDGTVGNTDQPFSITYDLQPGVPVEVPIEPGYNTVTIINRRGTLYISFEFEGNKEVMIGVEEIMFTDLEYDYKAYSKIILKLDPNETGSSAVKLIWT